MKKQNIQPITPIIFPRADPNELEKFDMSTKRCTMNCGPHRDDPRSEKERVFLCEDCEVNSKSHNKLILPEENQMTTKHLEEERDKLKNQKKIVLDLPTDNPSFAFQVSKTLAVAQIYIKTRKDDYEKFCKEFTLSVKKINSLDPTTDERFDWHQICHEFPNNYTALIQLDGRITLVNNTEKNILMFDTYDQFAAYYLAKFW